MDKKQINNDSSSFNLLHILRLLRRKAWIIVIAGILAGTIGFVLSAFVMTPQYSSSVMLYVNNTAVSQGVGSSVSSSELSAAQSLVKTYIVILQNRTTLDEVIETGKLDCTYKQLENMISASSVNETEVLQVTVTCDDAVEAAKIANAIADVLPGRVSSIIENSKMVPVGKAVVNPDKVFPSITGFTALGLILGVILSVVTLSVIAILDDTIRDEEYILQNCDYPVLAKIPDLSAPSGGKSYAYYYKNKSSAE